MRSLLLVVIVISTSMSVCSSNDDPPAQTKNELRDKKDLTADQMRVVREAVYAREASIVTDRRTFIRSLLMPEPLGTLYKQNPQPVLELLLVIMEGANPRDSSLAAGYAFELMGGPGRGVVMVEFFDKKTYDTVDKDWETTPRQHWIRHLRAEMKSKNEKEK